MDLLTVLLITGIILAILLFPIPKWYNKFENWLLNLIK